MRYRPGSRHRYWSCTRKCGYWSRERAQNHANVINTEDPTARVAVYACGYCGRYHIGGLPLDRRPLLRWRERWEPELGERAARCLREENRGEAATRAEVLRGRTRQALRRAGERELARRGPRVPRPGRFLP